MNIQKKLTASLTGFLILSAVGLTHAQNVDHASDLQRITDTLALFKSPHSHYKDIYTRKDNAAQKDSSTYAELNNKALLGLIKLPQFTSEFESGNLGLVVFSATDTLLAYDVYSTPDPKNPVDTLLDPSSRWFYFKVENVKGKALTLNFKNSDPAAPVYSYNGNDWVRFDTTAVKHSFTQLFDNQSVYIAYYIPYTQKRLNEKFDEWQYRSGVSVFETNKTLGENEAPLKMLMVTNKFIKDKNKKKIYIHARIHPSETPSSWALEGLIDYLTGGASYAKALRDNFIFYILPFTNPTGVAAGCSRSASSGVNLEVNYNQPDSLASPEVKSIKKFIATSTFGGKPFSMFLNFHSQVANAQTFWIHNPATTSPLYFKRLMKFVTLMTSNNDNFSNEFLSYSNMNSKYLEGFFWDNFGEETLATTYETPYSYYNENPDREWVTVENLKEQGVKALKAIGDYYNIKNDERIIAADPAKSKDCDKKDDDEHIYLGKNYYVATGANPCVSYKFKKLPTGEYDVYKWVVGADINNAASDEENCWKKIGELSQAHAGNAVYHVELTDNEAIGGLLLRKNVAAEEANAIQPRVLGKN